MALFGEWLGTEYAKRAGTTQAVMTRILFALCSGSRGRRSGSGLVQQVTDPQDGRRTQTFLTARGNTLAHGIVRLIRSDRQRQMKLRKSMMTEKSPRDLERDQWLSKLIAAGLKLGADDIQLAIRQVEALLGHRRSKRSPRPHRASGSPKLFSGRARR